MIRSTIIRQSSSCIPTSEIRSVCRMRGLSTRSCATTAEPAGRVETLAAEVDACSIMNPGYSQRCN